MGCQKPPREPVTVATRLATSKLSILVVNDPPLAAGIQLLRGEWAERSGGQLEIEQKTVEQLLGATELSVDLLIFPSRYVGTLVDRDWLRVVRKSVLQSPDVAMEDMFPLIRNALLPYGDQVYALTLGEPPLMWASLVVDPDDPGPTQWDSIGNLATLGASQLQYPHAVALIARGVSYAQVRSGAIDWFDAESMQPQIAEPPYLHALKEMVGNQHSSAQAKYDGSLGWPTGWSTGRPTADSTKSPRYFLLPLADKVFHPLRGIWEKRESRRSIAFLGFAGRSVSVTRSTRNAASAFKLLKWLISESIATQLSPRSEATVWFRKSQASEAKRWLAKSGANDKTAAAISKLLTSGQDYLLPRIPGVDQYLEALEGAIGRAISKELSAEQALAEVVAKWNRLTDRYGRDRQRAAYRKHLGLNDE